ncbi:MAG: RagB/SusD family nutrient uptake outer membrane protein, partial [Muribaculaceae bacterium]|nr:RagB/SusD family nutrient uptake outer membrane protein [Muribaculaceae bacterium]
NPHNFMRTATHSIAQRWTSNGRYTCSRDAQNATFRGEGPTWITSETGYLCHPCFSGKIFQYDNQGVRLFFAKQQELFEYTDKIARTGYAHIVRTDFTAEETLLCRAEARLFLGDIEGCLADLQTWEDPHWNCTVTPRCEQPKLTYQRIKAFYKDKDPGYGIVKPINIDKVYPIAEYTLNEQTETILQCIQHFRRIETLYDGLRWYDVKRFGIELEHQYSRYDVVLKLSWDDPRRALQIPPDVLSAGFEPNNRVLLEPDGNNESLVTNNEVKL